MHLKQLKVVYELILVVVTYKRFKINSYPQQQKTHDQHYTDYI